MTEGIQIPVSLSQSAEGNAPSPATQQSNSTEQKGQNTQSSTTQQEGTSTGAEQQSSANSQQPKTVNAGTESQQQPSASQEPSKDGQKEQQQQSSNSQPDFKIPDQYKDKGWAAKVKNLDDLFKQVDELDTLKGRKSIVPDLLKATPEEKEAFYAQMRPKDASEYKFTGEMASPAVKDSITKAFMDNGISAVQGNAVIESYMSMIEGEQTKLYDPEGFKTAMQQTFGDGWEGVRDGVAKNFEAMMTPEDFQLLNHMPNAYVNLVYRTLGNTQKAVENMMARYGVKETNLAHFASKTNLQTGDINAQRTALRAQMTKLVSGPHTAEQINDLRAKLAKTYDNDPRIQKGA